MADVRGRTVVITGAARGIGYATAQALLAHGARVVIGDRDVALLASAVDALSGAGAVTGHPLDVTDRNSFAEFVESARADCGGRIDVLINNAGVMPVGHFLDQPDGAVRSAIEVNVYGVLNGCRLVLPEMVARGNGHIVNIASMAGMVAIPGQIVYAGSKFAVVGLSTAMADEFAPHGVDVSVVMPPFTQTELIAGTRETFTSRPVPPKDIAAAIVRVLQKPKTHVAVPQPVRFFGPLFATLGPRGRRWLNRRMQADRLFLELDTDARRAYEARAQSAIGVVSNPEVL